MFGLINYTRFSPVCVNLLFLTRMQEVTPSANQIRVCGKMCFYCNGCHELVGREAMMMGCGIFCYAVSPWVASDSGHEDYTADIEKEQLAWRAINIAWTGYEILMLELAWLFLMRSCNASLDIQCPLGREAIDVSWARRTARYGPSRMYLHGTANL